MPLPRCSRARRGSRSTRPGWSRTRAGSTPTTDAHPNQPGSAWQVARTVTLEATEHGDVLVDVLQDGRIGSIELLDQLRAAH